jgi:cysteine desulfurase
MMNAYSEFGNPSSVHREGQSARKALEEARDSIASCLNCDSTELYFTSSGTESDNWAIRCAGKNGKHIITSSIGHPAVLRACEEMEKDGCRVTYLPVDNAGRVAVSDLENAFAQDTSLVSIMMANNEIGTIQNIAELARSTHANGALFHTDSVQAVGSIPVDFRALDVDLLSFSAHKFHGPKGVGGLVVRKGVDLTAFIVGGSQEFRHRAGTENVPGIIGMAKALELATESMEQASSRIRDLSDLLRNEIKKVCPQVLFHGNESYTHPGIVNLYVPGMEGEKTLLLLDVKGFACSGGAACSSKDSIVSHVLTAIGASTEEAKNSLRISIGADNTEEEIISFVSAFSSILRESLSGRK